MPFHQAASSSLCVLRLPPRGRWPRCPWSGSGGAQHSTRVSQQRPINRSIRAESCSNPPLQPLMLHPNANTRELLCPARRDNAINNALCTSVYVSAFRPADSIIPGVNKTPDMNQCCCRIQTKPRGNAFPGRNLEPSSFFSTFSYKFRRCAGFVLSPDQPDLGSSSRTHLAHCNAERYSAADQNVENKMSRPGVEALLLTR